jgi:hypothetical protein
MDAYKASVAKVKHEAHGKIRALRELPTTDLHDETTVP